jgi:aldehyde dehydrogenase (NAD+)
MAQAKKAISKTSGKLAARKEARAAVKTYQNYINGEWVDSQSGEMFENINPADTRDIVGRFPLSTSDDVNRARSIAGVTHPHPNARKFSFVSARS